MAQPVKRTKEIWRNSTTGALIKRKIPQTKGRRHELPSLPHGRHVAYEIEQYFVEKQKEESGLVEGEIEHSEAYRVKCSHCQKEFTTTHCPDGAAKTWCSRECADAAEDIRGDGEE